MSSASLNAQAPGCIEIDTGVVNIPATSTWTLVGVIELGGVHKNAFLAFAVGSADLLGIKLSRSETSGGHDANKQIDWREDVYFDSTGISMPGTMTRATFGNGPNLPNANARKHVNIHSLEAVQEIGIWAQSANASTLQVTGSII